MLPDVDILAAGLVFPFGLQSEEFHRTFTHSIFTAAFVAAVFCMVGRVRNSSDWIWLGVGLSLGMMSHMLLDLLLWFRPIKILWPIDHKLTIWGDWTTPDLWKKIELSAEFLCFAAFFVTLIILTRRKEMGGNDLPRLRRWIVVQATLFVLFLAPALVPRVTLEVFTICWWPAYVPSLGLMFYVIVRVRGTTIRVVGS